MFGDLMGYYIDGGKVMHGISMLSLASVTVIIYKMIALFRSRTNLGGLVSGMRGALLKGNVKGAMTACEEEGGPVAAICKAGLLKYDSGADKDEVERTMENAAIHEVAYLEKFLTVLATVTNIAPMLGFLGTVVGMIASFDVIAEQGLNDPGAVAKGISVALLTTAYGLIVAFITQPFYNYFTSKIATYTREMETASNILFETFDEMKKMGPK